MQKKVYILFVGLFLAIFLLGIISAESCDIRLRTECQESPWNNILLGLSDFTNAHGELWNEGSYEYVLCCDFVRTHDCSGTNKIIGLSSDTNAHAEIPSLDNYGVDVCYGDLSCRSTTENCFSYEIGMISLSDETNAHIGGFDDYETKICCVDSLDVEIYDYTIDLKEGWNLISIPLIPEDDDTSIESVFSEIIEDVEQVWGYQYDDKSNENKWSFYTPITGDLNEIIPGYGYYVQMNQNDILILRGKKVYEITGGVWFPPAVTLAPSWNLIGHYGLNIVNKQYAFTTLSSIYSTLLDKNGNSVNELNPTQGYWLFIVGGDTFYAPSEMSYM